MSSRKYIISAGKMNEHFGVMKKKMLKDLEEFRSSIVLMLLRENTESTENSKEKRRQGK